MIVKNLLLGTAAGLVAVAGAQAADMPVKAAPVQYVKICSLYGDGFYYIPNTDTCIKMGGYARAQGEYNAGGGGVAIGNNSGGEAAQARFTRDLTNDYNYRVRGAISWDVRQLTEYGTLRTYIRFGAENTTPTNTGGGTTASPFWDRAFIQFAGFTVGRSQSFFDLFTYAGAMSYHSVRTSGDTGITGQNLWGYTAQFDNGFSGSLSLEDPATRKQGTIDANNTAFWGVNGAVNPDNAFAVNGAPGAAPAGGFGFRMPNIVVNGRVDQAWGFAGISAAISDVSGGYYSTATTVAVPGNNVNNGHPADKIGWAVSAGASFNLPGGDTFGVNACYAEGATGFCTNMAGYSLYNASTSIGLGWQADAVFSINPVLAGQVELTRVWSALVGYQHIWNPRWRTSWFGGYVNIDYNSNATAIICANRANITPLAGAQPAGFNCSPDWSFYEIGTRTQFNPVAQLDIGLELLYTRVNTAFKGPANVAANGSRPAVNLIDDQGVWSAFLRWQRNFYP
jgi:Porin subfamily